ncbi:MAG: aminotransferase class V-fold PLP-dependent enzyme [Syntrophales bacterium]|nr:aminotransferase class V-fold PLP-dependent enzyme [Syntrophales bacterium]
MPNQSGRHFLQIPGPTNVPERVLRAMAKPTIDHRGPEFKALAETCFAGCRRVFKTKNPVIIFASSGTGAWEAGLVNTLSPGDKVLMFETGHFATLWKNMALRLGLEVDFVPGDWRHGVDPDVVEAKLAEDRGHSIKSVNVVHNETSTGCLSRIAEIRKAIDRTGHPALFMVDTISSLGSVDFRHDEWAVDVTVGCSQKGLMLPPGLGFNAVSDKALAVSKKARLPKSYWSWEEQLSSNKTGFFPSSPATNLLYGLRESLSILEEEGLEEVYARHRRHGEATRRALKVWGLENLCLNPAEYSPILTTVLMPGEKGADAYRKEVLEKFNMSLGSGLGLLRDRVFRIGHLGDFNDLSLIGTLGGVEMGFALANIPHRKGGVQAAMDYLTAS